MALGAGRRAAFKAAGATGGSALESLEAEGAFLDTLNSELTPSAIRVNKAQFLDARTGRRNHEAASFLNYDHFRGDRRAGDRQDGGRMANG
jgi:hypothetical protein